MWGNPKPIKWQNMQDSLFPDFSAAAPESGKNTTAASLLDQEGIAFKYITSPEHARGVVKSIMKGDLPLGIDTETAKLKGFSGHPRAGLDPTLSRTHHVGS